LKTALERRGKKAQALATYAGNPAPAGKSKQSFFRHPIFIASGFAGFKISAQALFSAKQYTNKWNLATSGTVNVQDFIIIIHSIIPRKVLDVCKPLQLLETKIVESGINLNDDVDPDIFCHLLQKMGIIFLP